MVTRKSKFREIFDLDQIIFTTEEGKYIVEFYEEGFEVTFFNKIDDEDYESEGKLSPFYQVDEDNYEYVLEFHYRNEKFPEP